MPSRSKQHNGSDRFKRSDPFNFAPLQAQAFYDALVNNALLRVKAEDGLAALRIAPVAIISPCWTEDVSL